MMRSDTYIKVFTWLAALLVVGICLAFPSCTHDNGEAGAKTLVSLDKQDSSVFKPVRNNGTLTTQLNHNILSLTFFPLREETISVIRIYDAQGGIRFIKKDPISEDENVLQLDFSHYEKGEYVIVASLSNGQLIEEFIQLS